MKNILCIILLVTFGFASRFFGIGIPDEVVFDEVHFGKYMSFYLRREFYFDVHPPLGRLLFAAIGYLIGYDGNFLFESIGDSYTANSVPYISLRFLPSFLASLIPFLVFDCLRISNVSLPASVLASCMILLDSALITASKFILLDSALIFFMFLSLYCWIKFSQLNNEFSKNWWFWLLSTGASLGCVASVKFVGLFTVATIGMFVIYDLWILLDYKRTLISAFAKHFAARFLSLVILPFLLYTFFFWIHISVLSKSGTGNSFISSKFQASLANSNVNAEQEYISFGSNITIKHEITGGFLHSHFDRYPLRYPDNRISSQGQQVTVYHHQDHNNLWRILPADPAFWPNTEKFSSIHGKLVKNNDIIILEHLSTNSHLLTHDVASPSMPTNQEFTTVTDDIKISRIQETMFKVDIDISSSPNDPNFPERNILCSFSSKFKLIHIPTGVALFSHAHTLPAWAFHQQEVNGNKNPNSADNTWFIESVKNPSVNGKKIAAAPPKTSYSPPSFLEKFIELHGKMFSHNSKLTASHPFQSSPWSWPFVLDGISYWQKTPGKQIFLLPNIAVWYHSIVSIVIFLVMGICVLLAWRRGFLVNLPEFIKIRNLLKSFFFFFVAWLVHYFPFFLMSRTLFLHHYLPASVAACCCAAVAFDLICTFFTEYNSEEKRPKNSKKKQLVIKRSKNNFVQWTVCIVFISSFVFVFLKFFPLTYGNSQLSNKELEELKWIKSWRFESNFKPKADTNNSMVSPNSGKQS